MEDSGEYNNKTGARYVRWQQATREQLGTTVSVVLTLATATLGFAASLLGKDTQPFHGWVFVGFCFSGMILALSAFCGLRVHRTRLLDFRWTARAVRLGDLIMRLKRESVEDVDWRWPSWLGELQKLRGYQQPSLVQRLWWWIFPQSPLLSGEDPAVVNRTSVAAGTLLGIPNMTDSENAGEIVREFCRDQAERFGRETWGWLGWQFFFFFVGVLVIFISLVARGSTPSAIPEKNAARVVPFSQTSPPPPDSGKPQNCASAESANACCCQVVSSQPIQAPPATAATSAMLVPLVVTTGLIVAAGFLLLLYGKGRAVRTVGAVTLLGGLTGHLIHEVKIDNLLKVDGPKIQAEIHTELNKLVPSGPEHLGSVEDFDPGRSNVKPIWRETINGVCTTWKTHGGGKGGLLLVVGATDRVPLSPSSLRQYESNFGLARARAEAVMGEIAECGVPIPEMLALVSGPKNTPESVGRQTPPSDFPKDRRVDIWGLWGRPSTESRSQGLQTSVEIKKQQDVGK